MPPPLWGHTTCKHCAALFVETRSKEIIHVVKIACGQPGNNDCSEARELMYGDSRNVNVRQVGHNRFIETAVLRNMTGQGMYVGVES